MTRYVLCGGDPTADPAFWAKLQESLPPAGRKWPLRCLHFDWGGSPGRDAQGLLAQAYQLLSLERVLTAGLGRATYAHAAHPHGLPGQLGDADLLWLGGGTTTEYLAKLSRVHWNLFGGGKVVVGLSAGANALARACYGLDARQVIATGGPVPAKVIVHWGSAYGKGDPRGPIDWAAAEEQLRRYKPDPKAASAKLPVVTLGEGEWRAFDV